MALATDERADLVSLLETLTAEQWASPSLCAGWRVRDVVAHVFSYEELSWPAVAATLVRGRLSPARINDVAMAPYADRTDAQLLDLARRHLVPRGFTAIGGGTVAVTDALIHHQDVRRPLGLTRDVPPERLHVALDTALKAPVLPSRKHVAGLRLVATDLDWAHGDGPRVDGPGEALLLAVAGRAVALDDLAGDGVETLRRRLA
jgi:uncharacterized protein (TIGR03083 family)